MRQLCKRLFASQFTKGDDISDDRVLMEVPRACAVDPDRWQTMAQQDRIQSKLRDFMQEACTAGIFGAPSFLLGKELFRGQRPFRGRTRMGRTPNHLEPAYGAAGT